ncbi:MAG: TraM recognition domain-containing protein [Bacteroidetes bacterium]|nr:MAG: TraM recognition domain-containing protein [Bacteroidota bacterium]
MELPYGYRWLLETILCTVLALIATWIFYPTDTSLTHYFYLTGFEESLYFAARAVRYFIIVDFLFKMVELAGRHVERTENGGIVSTILYIIPVVVFILCARDLFFIGKGLVEAYNANPSSEKYAEYLFKHEWKNLLKIAGLIIALPLFIQRFPVFVVEEIQKLKEHRKFRQIFKEGRGGSARWATTPTYERFRADAYMENKKLVLGRSLFEDDMKPSVIGIDDDAHMITVGMTGSGKSTTVLLPNLATYRGSVIVFDPKGELAMKTFRCRSDENWLRQNNVNGRTSRHLRGGRAFVFDPFGETKDLPRWSYNILCEIDINSDRVRELLSAISDGCVRPEKDENIHFEEVAKYFIEGAIAHVLSWYPEEDHTMPFVFDLISGVDTSLKSSDPSLLNRLLYEMLRNDAAGGLPQQVAANILEMGDREKGSVLSTVSRSLKWAGDPAMRKHLVNSDFRFSQIGASTTVYFVLPDGLIKEQMRWLRTMISVSLGLVKNIPYKPTLPTLFIIDELPRLGGKIEAVAEGFGILRGYGIKLWAFIQDIGQLERDYPDRWTSMTANSTVQVFGVNDMNTAEWVSEMLGASNYVRKSGKDKSRHETIYPLLTPNEVMIMLGKTENRQIVKTAEGFPMRLERCSYKPLNLGKHGFLEYSKDALRGCFEDW